MVVGCGLRTAALITACVGVPIIVTTSVAIHMPTSKQQPCADAIEDEDDEEYGIAHPWKL